ncbi:rhamnan synthesis F family protein [Yoonia sp. I 8.24]|uniref:rhamnan synthesis F family protein n=1 Tax=Yoonia sp. I 8.24 TaxID=1537229 RepID=UPI001EE05E07|nr:rhamnan synthesis F family protein [Yoonia sp. I 8.24]MCG3267390.1 rhamnan synthesis protein F family [Yoonia sp. I 8.24]
MPPVWKLKRELIRLASQTRDLPRRVLECHARKKYDSVRWDNIRISGASEAQTSKYCILLVFQPAELPASLIRTCEFMKTKGYNVIVVANGGLRVSAREQVLTSAWRLLERPNFGYDFGGMRDAIHYLQEQQVSPTKLALMNDSIWFPMWTGSDVIERLECSGCDVTGLLLHVPTRNEYPNHMAQSRPLSKRAEHIESYLTMVSAKAYDDPAFAQFWATYEQTNSKILTIKRGEVGFSRAMENAGLTVGALSRRWLFLQEIKTRSDRFIEQTLRYAAYSDAHFERESVALLAAPRDGTWRDDALEHIEDVVRARRFNVSFCWATEQIFQTAFLKKNIDRLFRIGRIRFLEGVDNGDILCDNLEALAELRTITEIDRVKVPENTWSPR